MEGKSEASPTLIGLTRSEIFVGFSASAEHLLQEQAFDVAAAIFGAPDADRAKLPDSAYALIIHGLVLDFISRHLPGPGADVLGEDLTFLIDPAIGDNVTVQGAVSACSDEGVATIAVVAECQRGRLAEGAVRVRLPEARVTLHPEVRPDIILHRHRHLERLMARSADTDPVSVAVVWPCDHDSLMGALEGLSRGALRPYLIGPRSVIEKQASASDASLDGCEFIEAETPQLAAAAGVRLCREGVADTLMKGSLHTDELMAAVVAKEGGLRGKRRISHVFAMDVPSYPKPLFVTDAAINIVPDLGTKVDIIQNAVDMLHMLGIAKPKVAILSAVETVNPKIPSTIDAAALCKMADRGQIVGALLDGPLAFDNAISSTAAAIKRISSPVAGDADILVVPDLESGNILAKQLSYLAAADSAGIVLGARVPIILTSRADSVSSRLASIAIAQILVAGRPGKSITS